MILFNEKLDWNNVKKVISDPKAFVYHMKGFDFKSLDQKRINTLQKKYINQKGFVSAEVEKKSVAAKACVNGFLL